MNYFYALADAVNPPKELQPNRAFETEQTNQPEVAAFAPNKEPSHVWGRNNLIQIVSLRGNS